jgi:hypothetical protein
LHRLHPAAVGLDRRPGTEVIHELAMQAAPRHLRTRVVPLCAVYCCSQQCSNRLVFFFSFLKG